MLTVALIATLLFEARGSLTGASDPGFLEFIPVIAVIAFLENVWLAIAAIILIGAAGLGARIVVNGQALADEWVHAALFLLSGAIIVFLFYCSRQRLRAAFDVKLEAVHAAESRYRRAFERAAIGFATASDKGELLRLNGRLCAMIGYSEGDLVGRRIEELVHQDDRDLLERSLAGLSAETPSFGSEIRLTRRDGSTLWARMTLSLSTPDTLPLDSLFVVVEDVTEQKSARGALVAQREWLNLATSAGRLGLWRIEYGENVVSGSSQFWELFGLSPAALRPLGDLLAMVHPADWATLASPPGKSHPGANYDAEVRVRRADGQIRWIALRGREENNDDRIQRIGIAADLTERRQTTLLRAAVRKQERRLLEQRHRFSNLFPVIKAMVKIVNSPDGNLAKYKDTLLERIRALEATHLLLASGADASSTIRDLVIQELRPYSEAGKTTVTGPEVKISGGAAESFAMIVHELTTNSIKHGVLGDTRGKVEVRWAFVSSDPDGEIVFDWIETGRRRASAIKHQGFGSMVLGADGIPLVGHSSKLELREDGLLYSLRLSPKEILD